MELEFDLERSTKNQAERGFGFAYAARGFQGRPTVFQDSRRDYGEARMSAIDGQLFKVVFTDRGEVRRITSAHRASLQEKRLWPSSE